MSNQEILLLQFYSNDLGKKITVKGFFKELLKTLFDEMECFNAKRPFGNSSWDGDLIVLFIKLGIIKGELDEYGYINNYDYKQYKKVIQSLIRSL